MPKTARVTGHRGSLVLMLLAGPLFCLSTGCVGLMNISYSRGSGPGVQEYRTRQSALSPPGRNGFYFESTLRVGAARITLAPENQRTRFVLFGPVLPIIPLWSGLFGSAPEAPSFWIAVRIDSEEIPYAFDPGNTMLHLEGGPGIRPEGFYRNDCNGRDRYAEGRGGYRYGDPLEPLTGEITLEGPACLNLAFPVPPPDPADQRGFTLQLDGLKLNGVRLDVPPITFTPDHGWLFGVEGAS